MNSCFAWSADEGLVLDVRTPGCLLAEFPHAFCRLTCLIRIGLCVVRHGPVRGGDQPGPSETRGAFPEACSEDRLRAGPCSVRRQLLFYIRTLCSLLRNLAVRADTERKPAENKIRTYVRTYVPCSSARHVCVWVRTCVHVVMRAADSRPGVLLPALIRSLPHYPTVAATRHEAPSCPCNGQGAAAVVATAPLFG